MILLAVLGISLLHYKKGDLIGANFHRIISDKFFRGDRISERQDFRATVTSEKTRSKTGWGSVYKKKKAPGYLELAKSFCSRAHHDFVRCYVL